MRSARGLVFVLLAVALSLSGCASKSLADENVDGDSAGPGCSIDLENELAKLGVPGLAAGVIKDGRLVCTAVAGHADREAGRAVETDTLFEWASVSKTLVATAVMILVDEGQIDLDDDVSAHLPFVVRNPECPHSPITVRQLMTHTSSIVDNYAVYDASYTVGDSPVALGDFLRNYLTPSGALYDAAENFDYECPGNYYEYSNIAAGGLVGYLVEKVSGQDFDAFAKERIFDPLGMRETSFRLAKLDVDDVAVPYEVLGGGAFRRLEHPGYATYPDGLLRASVPDLARFLAMITKGGKYNGQRIVSEAAVAEMARPQIPEIDPEQGLIWFYDLNGLLGHDGEDDGYSSLMFFDPKDGTGALLVGNAVWWDTGEAEALELFDSLMGAADHY